jgi:hypothetical protein
VLKFQTTINILSADTTRSTGLVNWPGSFQFPAGSTVIAFANYRQVTGGVSPLNRLPFWTARIKQATPTQYEAYAYGTGSAAGANEAMTVDIVAFALN